MAWLVRSAAIALLLAPLLALPAGRAYACSCGDPGSPAENMARADVVFSGRAVSPTGAPLLGLVEFEVYRVWKGEPYSTIVVLSSFSALCYFTFVGGEEYLVYAYTEERARGEGGTVLESTICSRTTNLEYAQDDIEALGPGRAPDPGMVAPDPRREAPLAPPVAGAGPASGAPVAGRSPGGPLAALALLAALAGAAGAWARVRRPPSQRRTP